jgi:hypothetical protein
MFSRTLSGPSSKGKKVGVRHSLKPARRVKLFWILKVFFVVVNVVNGKDASLASCNFKLLSIIINQGGAVNARSASQWSCWLQSKRLSNRALQEDRILKVCRFRGQNLFSASALNLRMIGKKQECEHRCCCRGILSPSRFKKKNNNITTK